MKTFLEKVNDFQKLERGFKCYVPSNTESTEIYLNPVPNLLSGEAVIAEATKVQLTDDFINNRFSGTQGSLFVTNFRLFLVPECPSSKEPLRQRNQLIGDYGVTLTNIDAVYHITGDKRRKLTSNTVINDRIKGLQVVCKNFRVLSFNFDSSPFDHGKNIAKTILHHSFPSRHSLLFAYDYSEPETGDDVISDVREFRDREDWINELQRTCKKRAEKWRVSTQINDLYGFTSTMPRYFVVPKEITEYDLATMSGAFRCCRPPCWTFSTEYGAVIVRMADLLPTVTDRTQENRILEYIRKTHPDLTAPVIRDLSKELPAIQDIYLSYLKLRDLFTPDSERRFKSQDTRYYHHLEQSKWLHYVSSCLKCAKSVAAHLLSKISVVLQEYDGTDTSAVVSSLVQLMLDKNSRTIFGFQSLIQKEWVVLGHPFCSRLGHIQQNDSEQGPVFLLFLDCTWQLLRQFPSSFEFSETYLITLFDSCYLSVFDTFLFNCEKERNLAVSKENLKRRSVWNWDKQFSKVDQYLFINPLYDLQSLYTKINNFDVVRSIAKVLNKASYLNPKAEIPNLEVWNLCYSRWLPSLVIKCGGFPQIDLEHRRLRHYLDALVNKLDGGNEPATDLQQFSEYSSLLRNSEVLTEITKRKDEVDSNFPFASSSVSILNLLADLTLSDFDAQSLLNMSE